MQNAVAQSVDINEALEIKKIGGAFRTISEVASDLGVQQHVLRFWETKFNQIRPMKRGGGRRYYRAEDVTLLKHIHTLLYSEGYTIKGAQKLLKGQSKGAIAAAHAANDAADKASRAAQNASPVISAPKPVAAPQPVKVEALSSSVAEALTGLLTELKELRALVAKTA